MMGNKLGKKRQMVEEKYTRPQGLYQHKDVDHKKLRKLILDSKLAPCFPGDEECALDLEECPICFLYYPSLNRSRCCMKGICTECFLQMKPPHSTRPTQCPFCKTSSYAVEYRGMRTKEEKGMEQVEEQRVIEAKIRMRQQELQDEQERMQKKMEISSSSRVVASAEVEDYGISSSSVAVPSLRYPSQDNVVISSQASCTTPPVRHHLNATQNREEDFDLDLEEIMVMEAIWLSIQECGSQRHGEMGSSVPPISGGCYLPQAPPSSEASPSNGLVCAVAALAERQHLNGSDHPLSHNIANASATNCISSRDGRQMANYTPQNWIEVSSDSGGAVLREEDGEWAMDHGSVIAEAGTSYSSSSRRTAVAAEVESTGSVMPDTVEDPCFQPALVAGNHPRIPESFEEQMMLAMAFSVAEAQARKSPHGLPWM
ncbi:hypothetical protein QJS04_geneDACA017826 [Acorus gramineus]|uniref:RING-type domain-containing protein n=1 Tax=Acorus gramineus TaxID=55184 RepID=A0AAV9A395_ACOGR|nr:hypothetical protein QJS04_geneDACA017826 [Acorus gramineus]